MNNDEVAGTGIHGLDYILLGGFPRNRIYLIQGDPGVGKTTLGLQFLLEGAKHGERGLYITLSESSNELNAVAKSHGWSLDEITIFEQMVGEEALHEEESTVFYPSEIELGETIRAMLVEVDRVKPQRVVLDSLSEIRLLAQSGLRYRKQILAMKQFFAGRNVTVLCLDDRTSEIQDIQLQSVPHGVLELERFTPVYGSARRRMQLVKVRGLNFKDGYHDFNIITGGLVVFPRLVAASEETAADKGSEQIESGLAELDSMLGGGLNRGTSTVIMGPAGSGKSALAMQYAVASARRGERSVAFIFEESVKSVTKRSASLGLPVDDLLVSGSMAIRRVDPAQLQPGEFSHLVRESVEENGARLVVIDSLNGYLNAVPEERFLLLHLHELLSYLGQHGVATILVFAQHGLVGSMQSAIDVSYLADCVILLRYFEADGRIHKAASVVKKRTGPHETAIRSLSMDGRGLHIGEALTNYHGVLSGIPNYDHTLNRERSE